MGGWFAGVVDDLATEAVRGVRVDTVPLVPAPPTSYARDWIAEFDRAYAHGTREWVDREIRRRRAEQERRDRNMAMVLWGVHL